MQYPKERLFITSTGFLFLILLFSFQLPITHAAEDTVQSPPVYLPLEPKLIVNLQGRRAYLRTDIQLLITDKERLETIRHHIAPVRHALIMLFGGYTREQLNNSTTREEVRKNALLTVRQTLETYASSEGLKDLFFTEFLVQ